MSINFTNIKAFLLIVVMIDIAKYLLNASIKYISSITFNIVRIYFRIKIAKIICKPIHIYNIIFTNPKVNGIGENGLLVDILYYNGSKCVGVKIIDYKRWELGPMVAGIVEIHIASLLANLFADIKSRPSKRVQKNITQPEPVSFVGFCIPVIVELSGISIIRGSKRVNMDDVIAELRKVVNDGANYNDRFLEFFVMSANISNKYWYNNDKAT